jgi:hypothetical protein
MPRSEEAHVVQQGVRFDDDWFLRSPDPFLLYYVAFTQGLEVAKEMHAEFETRTAFPRLGMFQHLRTTCVAGEGHGGTPVLITAELDFTAELGLDSPR